MDKVALLLQQSTVIFEQSRMALLHLLEKRQEVAVALQKALFGGLRKSPGAVSDQGRPGPDELGILARNRHAG